MHTYTRTYTHFYAPPHPNTMVCNLRASPAREQSASCGSNRGPLPASPCPMPLRLPNKPPPSPFSPPCKMQFLSCTCKMGMMDPSIDNDCSFPRQKLAAIAATESPKRNSKPLKTKVDTHQGRCLGVVFKSTENPSARSLPGKLALVDAVSTGQRSRRATLRDPKTRHTTPPRLRNNN